MAIIIEEMEPAVVSAPRQRHGLARLSQFIDYAFMLLYTILAVRLILVFVHARTDAGFTGFIDAITNPFYAPFRGIVPSQDLEGGFTLATPLLIALVVYALLHLIINRLLRTIVYRRTDL